MEIFLLYLFGVGVAGSGIGGFFGHIFLSDPVAESIGWPAGNPFQLEVGVANLAVGILGIVAMGRRDGAASRRAERSPASQAPTPGFDQSREPRIRAAALMTGTVAAGFGGGVAVELPLIGTLVGTLVGAGLVAFVLARASGGSTVPRDGPGGPRPSRIG